jgi:hypothetical protein
MIIWYFMVTSHFNLYIKDWKDVVKKLEDLVFQYYTWNHSQDHNLRTIYDYIFATLKNHSEEITIFTTNYDKAIEIYCNRAGYQLVDGFWKNGDDYIWKDGEFYYPAITSIDEVKKHVYLYKLHGSLNWKKHIMGVIMRATEEGKSSDPNIKDNLLIYPTLSPKTDSGEPFNTIFREFNAKMNNVDVCVVIGFSFRDNDINETFRDFARSNPTTGRKKIIVISPSAQQDFFGNVVGNKDQDKADDQIYDTMYDKARLTLINKGICISSIEDIMKDIDNLLNS